MSNERDELADTLEAMDGMDYAVIADAIIAAGYVKADHAEYALDHKRSGLQVGDDDGTLWTDEEYIKDYADDYGDSAQIVKRHVTIWEPTP